MPPANKKKFGFFLSVHRKMVKITLMMHEFDFVSRLLGSEWYFPSFQSQPISASKMHFLLLWFTTNNFNQGKCEK